jgi:hypothetical protein
MAVNKNFVVKNGLEVATNVILADASTKNVGIGSTQPTLTLDVRGGIGATDLQVTGFSTFTDDIQVGASGSVFYVSNSTNMVGVGTSVPAYTLEVRGPVSTGVTALYVHGDMRVTGDINLDDVTLDDINATDIHISGLSTFVGFTTFNDYVFIQDGLNVTGAGITADTVNVLGVSTFVGFSTFSDYVFIQDGLNVAGVITATSFAGEGQIGVGSEGTFIGTGVTMIDFKSSNAGNTVDVTTGIATVTVQAGASIGLVIALGG